MKTEQIQNVIAISRFGSISAAAKELYLSQTTLSASMKAVEEEMGFAMFVRSRNGVTLTPEGEEALAIMKEMDQCIEKIGSLRESALFQYSTVKVITSPTIQSALSLSLNAIVKESIPECSLEFQIVTGAEVGKCIAKNKGNIGVTYMGNSAYEELNVVSSKHRMKIEKMFDDRFYLLLRKDHPFAKRDTISIKAIQNMEIAMLENYSTNANSLIHREAFGDSNRYTTFSSVSLLKKFIISRNAGGILTGYGIHHNQSVDSSLLKPVLLIDLDRPNQFGMYLLYRNTAELTSFENLVLNNLRSYFRKIILE